MEPIDPRNVKSRRILGALCVAVLAATLFAGLWPFNPFPKNQVTWIKSGGLQFGCPAIVLSRTPLHVRGRASTASASLELWFEPITQISGTIVGFYDFEKNRQFRITQVRDGLLLRKTARDNPGQKGPVIWMQHVLTENKRRLLSITGGPTNTTVFLDGQAVEESSEFTVSQTDVTGQIVLGSSPIYNTAWAGKIYALAVYNRVLTASEVMDHYRNWAQYSRAAEDRLALFLFSEGAGEQIENRASLQATLYIPRAFTLPHQKLLEPPWEEFRPALAYWKDLAMNVAGFVPLGFTLCLYARSKEAGSISRAKAVIAGAAVSLLIEVLQSFLPMRASGMTDLITNTLGTAIGVYLCDLCVVQGIFGALVQLPKPLRSERLAK